MDRISMLPDDAICHILSFLPTKHAVATSVLSSRWVSLWTFVPVIDLDDSLYLNPSREGSNSPLFIRFLERVLSMNRSETIVKFRLHMRSPYGETLSGINEFIEKVFSRNVVQVDLGIFSALAYDANDKDQCLKIPHSESLKALKVDTHYLDVPAFPACFPSLRVFDANFLVDCLDELLENLFPCLPALEKLCLVVDLVECSEEICVNVGGPALEHLDLQLLIHDHEQCDAMVVIDAPKLDYLRLQDEFMASYLVKHKPAITEVRLHVGDDDCFLNILEDEEVGPTRLTRFDKLLHGLVNTKFISVSASTLKLILPTKWNLPVLPYLTKLELDVPASCWMLLLHWLESCPNLKVLSLIIMEENDGEEFDQEELVLPDVVPSCLSSCINEIEIKRLGIADEEEMIKYLLDNAKVLDKFTVNSCV